METGLHLEQGVYALRLYSGVGTKRRTARLRHLAGGRRGRSFPHLIAQIYPQPLFM